MSSTAYGYIRDKLQIKYLLLFILGKLNEPVSFASLSEMTLCDDAIDYFDFADALAEMVSSGHVLEDRELGPEAMYLITPAGRQAAETCEKDIPYSARMAAQRSILSTLSRLRRDASISADTVTRDGQIFFRGQLRDDKGVILSLELADPTGKQSGIMENGFKKNAERVFNAVLSALLDEPGDREENEP